jgi:hypothetical protein
MIVVLVMLAQVMRGVASADGVSGADQARVDAPAMRESIADSAAAAEPKTLQPLWLPKTRSDWDEIVAVARVNPAGAGNGSADRLEEVVVTAPEDLLPMPGVYDEMWGGILAPVWAVVHPTQAWRIFLPIPPK